jgi:ABC-type Fe3+-citrate transport system substrate-binding protein
LSFFSCQFQAALKSRRNRRRQKKRVSEKKAGIFVVKMTCARLLQIEKSFIDIAASAGGKAVVIMDRGVYYELKPYY